MYTLEQLQRKNLAELKEIGWQLSVFPDADRRCRQNWIDAIVGINPPLLQLLEVSSAASVEQVQEPIEVQAQEPPIESKFGRIVYSRPAQKLSAQASKNSPGVEVEQVQEAIAPFSAIIEDSPGVKTEATVSESARGLPVKNPILTGVTLSDRFCVRYFPPQPENIRFQSDADGQLSLLNFEIESVDDPPDPEDFETLDAFREAIARWDFEHLEELAVSLDSMCEWAPCPTDWYEFDTEFQPSQVLEVSELSLARKSSITSDFFIPTFDAWCDRSNSSDEPPDTGVYARLPKPKPPSFPPMAVGQARAKLIPNSSQTHPKRGSTAGQPQSKRILNVYQTHTCCIVAGSSIQLARSPPGGDVM